MSDEEDVICKACPAGRTNLEGSSSCPLCKEMYYGYIKGGDCNQCTEVELPPRLPPNLAPEELRAMVNSPNHCPGGLPGIDAFLLPLNGVWIHITDTGLVELVPCQRAHEAERPGACEPLPLHDTANDDRPAAAKCGAGYEGFLCGRCTTGFEKIDGECLPCPQFDWLALVQSLVMNVGIALFLVHKSAKPVISAPEIRLIWNKVDLTETGQLDVPSVGKVLAHLGVTVSTKQLKKEAEVYGVDDSGFVQIEDFVNVESTKRPTQTLNTVVFFVQSLGLILKDAQFFGLLDTINLDVEAATGQCIGPLSTSERFYAKVAITPVVLGLSIMLVAVPLWNLLRRTVPQAVWDTVHSPPKATKTVMRRALLNAYLFCYAPLTYAAIEMLVCVPTCGSEGCYDVLSIDYGVSCWVTPAFYVGFAAGLTTLVVFSILIPAYLLKLAKRSVLQRSASLGLHLADAAALFDRLDADNSGFLEATEIRILLLHMGQPDDTHSLQQTITEFAEARTLLYTQGQLARPFARVSSFRRTHAVIAGFGAGSLRDNAVIQGQPNREVVADTAVSKAVFERWYRTKCMQVVDDPLDVLYGTTRPSAYYWFAQILWLKTSINVLFSFSQAAKPSDAVYNWQIWLFVILAVSICVMVNKQPYVSKVDREVELVALLCLGGIAQVGSLSKAGADIGGEYVVLIVVLITIPLVASAALKAQSTWQMRLVYSSSIAKAGHPKRGCCRKLFRGGDVTVVQMRKDAQPPGPTLETSLATPGPDDDQSLELGAHDIVNDRDEDDISTKEADERAAEQA